MQALSPTFPRHPGAFFGEVESFYREAITFSHKAKLSSLVASQYSHEVN